MPAPYSAASARFGSLTNSYLHSLKHPPSQKAADVDVGVGGCALFTNSATAQKGKLKMVLANIESRVDQRRNEPAGGSVRVVEYVRQVLLSQGAEDDAPTTFEHFRPYLTADEVAACEEQQRKDAAAKAAQAALETAMAVRRQKIKRVEDEVRETFYALWQKTPPDPVAIPATEATEATVEEVFDILARYHFTKAALEFGEPAYYREFGEEYMERFTGSTIEVWMGDDASTIEVELDSINYHGIELGSASLPKAVELNSINLPNDDDDGTICSYLYESMEELATEFVEEKAASKGKVVEGGTVTFDVAARKVTVRTTIEVTREEDFEESWIV